MLFSGIPFLFYFLPAVLLLYVITPRRLKNGPFNDFCDFKRLRFWLTD